VLNVLKNTVLMRRLQLGIYGGGAVAALLMAIFGPADARLPWFIIAMFSGGALFDLVRESTTR
jgi:hypothetical protein